MSTNTTWIRRIPRLHNSSSNDASTMHFEQLSPNLRTLSPQWAVMELTFLRSGRWILGVAAAQIYLRNAGAGVDILTLKIHPVGIPCTGQGWISSKSAPGMSPHSLLLLQGRYSKQNWSLMAYWQMKAFCISKVNSFLQMEHKMSPRSSLAWWLLAVLIVFRS